MVHRHIGTSVHPHIGTSVHQYIRTSAIIFIILISTSSLFSQDSLKENIVLEVKAKQRAPEQTKWEKLLSTEEFKISFRLSSIGSSDFLDLKIIRKNPQPFTIGLNQKLVFYFNNSDSVVLYNTQATNSCDGCGSINIVDIRHTGIEVTYLISKYELKKLEDNSINKFCVYTDGEKIQSFLFASEYNKILKAIMLTQDL